MADKSQKLAPKGYVPLRALCVELAAGGVERDNIEHVSSLTRIYTYGLHNHSMIKDLDISTIALSNKLTLFSVLGNIFKFRFIKYLLISIETITI